jgi:hypothetical protein
MAKEWLLNSVMNRFQLNFKRNVGGVSEAIRKCAPKSKDEWENYYFANVKSREHVEELGRKLYVKITEVITSEVESITERDCIEYMNNMVIDRTYDGYTTEIKTIYGQLERMLGVEIKPAPDEWDRLYNVDFFIEAGDKRIGLQVKPASGVSHIPEIYKERALQEETHKRFTQKNGGKVFYIISVKEKSGKKVISNMEVIDEIKREIKRLQSAST